MFILDESTLRYNGPKPKTEAEAKEISLEKWRVLANAPEGEVRILDGGISTCGYCMLYILRDCRACPIAFATGDKYCRLNNPYNQYLDGPKGEQSYWARQEYELILSL